MPTPVMLVSLFQKMWLWLDHWDTYLFLKINTGWTNSFLDSIYPWWREANTWTPLYLFLGLFAMLNFKKQGWLWVLFLIITVTLTDQISSTLIKSWIQRPRPCRDEFLMSHVRLLLNNCSGGYSFTSSHATNHFGLAMFVFITSQYILKKWRYVFLLWAATICYGQVYVGVHYPLDVLCGAMMGSLIGYLTAQFFIKKFGLLSFESEKLKA